MPRETLTSSPRPAAPAAGPLEAGPCASTGSIEPPCAPTPGTRNGSTGAIDRIVDSSSGAVAPTTSPTVPPGPQPVASRATRSWSRSAGWPSRACDDQVLDLDRARVRRPAQHVREPVGPFDERRDRLGTEVRVDRDRVGVERVEQRNGLPRGGRADVATLRVRDDGDVARDRRAESVPAPPSRRIRMPRRRRGWA